MAADRPTPHDDGAARPGVAVRDQMEALGQVSAELLHDLHDAMYALEQRTRMAAVEARLGRSPLAELERATQAGADMRAMLSDMLDVLRGSVLSPEVSFDPREAVERAVSRFLPASGPLEVRVACDLPPGARVPGRESFFGRLAANLLAGAARRSRGQVTVELRVDTGPRPGIVLSVGDDGAAPLGDSPAPHPRPSARDGWRPGIVAWLVTQLHGEVRCRPARDAGGSGLEIRLPAVLPRDGDDVPRDDFS